MKYCTKCCLDILDFVWRYHIWHTMFKSELPSNYHSESKTRDNQRTYQYADFGQLMVSLYANVFNRGEKQATRRPQPAAWSVSSEVEESLGTSTVEEKVVRPICPSTAPPPSHEFAADPKRSQAFVEASRLTTGTFKFGFRDRNLLDRRAATSRIAVYQPHAGPVCLFVFFCRYCRCRKTIMTACKP